MEALKQGTRLVAKTGLTLKTPGAKGRALQAKEGDIFIVTSPIYSNKEAVKIDRVRRAILNMGYLVGVDSIDEFFAVLD